MKSLKMLLIFLMLIFSNAYSSEEDILSSVIESMGKAKSEAKAIGESESETLIKRIGLGKKEKSSNAILSELELKVESIKADHHQAVKDGKTQHSQLSDEHPLKRAKKEEIDRAESFLIDSMKAINEEKFEEELGITSVENSQEPEQKKIQKCRENGAFMVSIEEDLKVTVNPPRTREVIKCQGHQEKLGPFYTENGAKKEGNKRLKNLQNDPSIQSQSGMYTKGSGIRKYNSYINWTHKDGTQCSKHYTKDVLVAEKKEIDHWAVQNEEYLWEMQNSPNCSFSHYQVLEGPEKRMIDGFEVSRDEWKRAKVFTCVGEKSACNRLRDLGGVMVGKKCLRETEFGECALWEKEFDMGGLASKNKLKTNFKNDGIYGLHEVETPDYERNTELADAVSKLSMLSDLSDDLSTQAFEPETVEIFAGTPRKCHRSFIGKKWYDCCKKKKGGLAVKAKLAECNEEENILYDMRGEEKCKYIGNLTRRMGLETRHVFCCFPTKLSKILHEAGRDQLGLSWGTAECPNCKGLTLQQFQSLDFDKIDLSEVLEEFSHKISAEELVKRLQNASSNLETQDHEAKTKFISDTQERGATADVT